MNTEYNRHSNIMLCMQLYDLAAAEQNRTEQLKAARRMARKRAMEWRCQRRINTYAFIKVIIIIIMTCNTNKRQ